MAKHVYRYQAFRTCRHRCNAARLILHNKIYAASSLSFNDPFDCSPVLSFKNAKKDDLLTFLCGRLSRNYQKEGKHISHANIMNEAEYLLKNDWHPGSPKWSEYNKELEKGFYEDIEPVIGIVSLSKTPNDILMWSHYSDGHRGLCLQFDRKTLDYPDKFLEVDYRKNDDRPTVKEHNEEADQLKNKFFLRPKASHWYYEKECRLCLNTTDGRMYQLPENALTGVILGIKMPDRYKFRIKEWAKKRKKKGSPFIHIFEAQPSEDKYEVNIPGLSS
ncbi:DUF2971 domain-containing protein [Verrucomicrobiota bacterium]